MRLPLVLEFDHAPFLTEWRHHGEAGQHPKPLHHFRNVTSLPRGLPIFTIDPISHGDAVVHRFDMDVGGTLRDRFLESVIDKRDFTDFSLGIVVRAVAYGETGLAGTLRLGWSFTLLANVFHAQSCGMATRLCNDSFR